MATRPQHSKRDRGRAHVGLPPKQEPKYGYCGECGDPIQNRGAHAEACRGPVPTHERRDWTGWYGVSGLCSCGWRRDGGRCVHGNPYVPVFRVTQATKGER